ncbi:Hypothetical protein PHPALM_12111 [Phytophthora palmivora]|uniref:Uncharacterized protein n=1 Tax=Phytophthora palmivora TaxID=4796 RepID=A0A2P4Y0K5_9STRA|nr:Hypothetical protein PHPALM_12111 [Phytophthora palmivora]
MDPNLLYARGLAKTEKRGGYGSLTAAIAYLEMATVNLAKHTGINNGVPTALEHTHRELRHCGRLKVSNPTISPDARML